MKTRKPFSMNILKTPSGMATVFDQYPFVESAYLINDAIQSLAAI